MYAALFALDPARYRDSLKHAVSHLRIDLKDLGHSEQEIADELDRLPLPD